MDYHTYSFIDLPAIYQVELVGGVCQLKCSYCPVSKGEVPRRNRYFDFNLLKEMFRRGDFEHTFYFELHMYGESMLHPQFETIVGWLKSNVKQLIGLSTNLIEFSECLNLFDALTISCDTQSYRKGRNFDIFRMNLEKLFKIRRDKPIDIQFVECVNPDDELVEVQKFVSSLIEKYNNRNVIVRSAPECFTQSVDLTLLHSDPCINPFISVSIQSDGDVVSCCFCWDKSYPNVYGNILDTTLSEVWQHSETRRVLLSHISGEGMVLTGKCSECLVHSPALLHWRFLCNYAKIGMMRFGTR
jgi:radical SAM protein with 4Fe4S-binding SPASM domain